MDYKLELLTLFKRACTFRMIRTNAVSILDYLGNLRILIRNILTGEPLPAIGNGGSRVVPGSISQRAKVDLNNYLDVYLFDTENVMSQYISL